MRNDETFLRKLWALKNFKPNSRQEEAILYDGDKPLFITAAPGSGKTRVLLWRTVNLIVCHGVKPEEIYLGTFTEKAAFQLREGLKSLLGLASNETNQQYDLSRMYLGTIHSNCHRILMDRSFSKDKHRMRAPILLDESQQYFHVYRKRFWDEMVMAAGFAGVEDAIEEINAYFGWRGKSRHHSALNCISLFNRLSEEVVDPRGHRVGDETLRRLLKMYEHYLNSLKMPVAKRTDLSLLQQDALRVISDNDGSGKLFKHIIKTPKQNLKIKTFVGTSKNALMVQIWTALIAILLLKYLKFRSQFNWSLSNLVAMLRYNLFTYRDLWGWINKPFEVPSMVPHGGTVGTGV